LRCDRSSEAAQLGVRQPLRGADSSSGGLI
jgi:hypothetical protein